jgi:hypothetical protein
MVRVARRTVFGISSLAGASALVALVGCSGAPEGSASTEEALPTRGGGLGGGGGVVIGPICPPSNEYPYVPAKTPSTFCSPAWDSYAFGKRALDRGNVFELALLDAGCSDSVAAVGGLAIPPGGVGWSFTSCPDTCEVRSIIHTYHAQNPIAALTSNVRITACSGVPAPNQIFAVWDPHCPSGCTPVATGI